MSYLVDRFPFVTVPTTSQLESSKLLFGDDLAKQIRDAKVPIRSFQVPVSSIISCVDITSRFIVGDENSPEPFCEIDGDDERSKALFS